jgi:hypothetical protein
LRARCFRQRRHLSDHLLADCPRLLDLRPGQELCEPWVFFGVLASTPQDSMRTNDQDATQVAIALFGDRPELPSAAGRI